MFAAASKTPLEERYSGQVAFDPEKKDGLQRPYSSRSVLFIGEGNFHFSHLVCTSENLKYKPNDGSFFEFSNYVVSTEFKSEIDCAKYEFTKKYITELRKIGALPFFEIDACKLQAHFPENHFKMIFFNCPDTNNADDESEVDEARFQDQTAKLVHDFFQSASSVQENGSRVYMTLIQPSESLEERIYYQSEKYGIVRASLENGYTLLCMREPIEYVHQKTKGFKSVRGAANGRVEFVFKKEAEAIPNGVSERDYTDPKTKKTVRGQYFGLPNSGKVESYFSELKAITAEISEANAQSASTCESSSEESD